MSIKRSHARHPSSHQLNKLKTPFHAYIHACKHAIYNINKSPFEPAPIVG